MSRAGSYHEPVRKSVAIAVERFVPVLRDDGVLKDLLLGGTILPLLGN